MLEGKNIVVWDCETLHSADDCKHCGQLEDKHPYDSMCPKGFTKIGWDRKLDLGLSIGCAYSYSDGRFSWFDEHTLEATMQQWVENQSLMVGFNSIRFDGALVRALLRNKAPEGTDEHQYLMALCDQFKAQCLTSYDILDQIWRQDSSNRFQKGNSLEAISVATGLGPKLSSGAEAPRLWRQRQWARVMNYCADDVYKTRALFEMICDGKPIIRGNGLPIFLPPPNLEAL